MGGLGTERVKGHTNWIDEGGFQFKHAPLFNINWEKGKKAHNLIRSLLEREMIRNAFCVGGLNCEWNERPKHHHTRNHQLCKLNNCTGRRNRRCYAPYGKWVIIIHGPMIVKTDQKETTELSLSLLYMCSCTYQCKKPINSNQNIYKNIIVNVSLNWNRMSCLKIA